MTIASSRDLKELKALGRVVAEVLAEMRAAARPGMTTAELDRVGARSLTKRGARSAPMLEYGFPGWTCLSVNDEIVHGVPGPRRLRAGDVLKIDVTAERGGYVVDAAVTTVLAPGDVRATHLFDVARRAFRRGADAARAGARLNAIGRAIEREATRQGLAVVRELSGHGVGRRIHEDPSVPNYEEPRVRTALWDGLVLAVEPMLTERPVRVVEDADGWTLRTHDGSIAVHYEHTIVVRDGAPVVLTRAA